MTPPILRTRKQMLRSMQPAPRDPIEAAIAVLERRLEINGRTRMAVRSGVSSAIAAYLRAVAAQPINATEDMPMAAYAAANARKDWAGRLAAELERDDQR